MQQKNIHVCRDSFSKLRRENEETNCAIMLLSVSFAFVLLTTPFYIVHCVYLIYRLKLAYTITDFLALINHSSNFFFYCASGKQFRAEFKMLLSSWRRCLWSAACFMARCIPRLSFHIGKK
ncbi:hypothetical protein HELRODRAFT_177652 [Helobdella robusta]|uniref:G-protein coupled receptors family 1 profile domain-containing protein n=1 Tax=Helobdella robusta TaxID=6412 RepID=T1FC08_HELRO|nr:hypothetical protein HELRODRAFT_177652 [Helobdella robusta]ESN97981.1 hypothetical protein HELRODRAFT_177652 [Helobdella robusta]